MRLHNMQKAGHYHYRVALDDANPNINFIERTKGVYYDIQVHEHRCLKCMSVVAWMHWSAKGAEATCSCGEKQTVEYLVNFEHSAKCLT